MGNAPDRPLLSPPSVKRLDSWKEIGVYLRRSVSTVKRWEGEEGMPVHRHRHEAGCTVYGYRSELDAWWHEREARIGKPASRARRPRARGSGAGVRATSGNKKRFVVDDRGKTTAVVLPIEDYERLLERLEILEAMASHPSR